MQLDQTKIAVRERSAGVLLDVTLHVTRTCFGTLLAALGLGVIPFAILNEWLLFWAAPLEFTSFVDYTNTARYLFLQLTLILLEAPLATVFVTAFLGQYVFVEQPRLRAILTETLRFLPRVLLCHVLIRGGFVGFWLVLVVDRYDTFSDAEGFLILVLFVTIIWRAFRPFLNEIILLERIPLTTGAGNRTTIARRSGLLHVNVDILPRMLYFDVIGTLLALSWIGFMVFMDGLFLQDGYPGPLMLRLVLPACIWLAVGFIAVARFLAYLDVRIRQEGWEVELRMRAEAARLMKGTS